MAGIHKISCHFLFSFRNFLCSDYEKSRNMENPFKYGAIVDADYFIDRVDEVKYISQFIQSANHLILISPRRHIREEHIDNSSFVSKTLKT